MTSTKIKLGARTLLALVATTLVPALEPVALAHALAAVVPEMSVTPSMPARIEGEPVAVPQISAPPVAAPAIRPRPAGDAPKITASPINAAPLATPDASQEAIKQALQRLEITAHRSKAVGSTAQSAQAAWLLGLIYLHGAGVRRDPPLARQWFVQAAHYGREPWAYAGLAWCYIDGCVGPPNPLNAARAIAQLRPYHPARADFLEWVLDERETPLQVAKPGVMQDQVLQLNNRQLLEKAAAGGDVHANIELGIDAANNRHYDQAAQYFRRAGPNSAAAVANLKQLAERASSPNEIHAKAPVNVSATNALALAIKYHRGQGVPTNFAEAIRFYQLAANRGSPQARRMLELINSRPGPGGELNPAWMQQLAYVDVNTVIPGVGVTGTTQMLRREPTPLYDLLPAVWRRQLTQVER